MRAKRATMVKKNRPAGRFPMTEPLPVHVTVVIPTRNEEEAIVLVITLVIVVVEVFLRKSVQECRSILIQSTGGSQVNIMT